MRRTSLLTFVMCVLLLGCGRNAFAQVTVSAGPSPFGPGATIWIDGVSGDSPEWWCFWYDDCYIDYWYNYVEASGDDGYYASDWQWDTEYAEAYGTDGYPGQAMVAMGYYAHGQFGYSVEYCDDIGCEPDSGDWDLGWASTNVQPATPVPSSLGVASDSYVAGPPPPYDRRRIYQIYDQFGRPMRGDIPGGLWIDESYSPDPPSGNCTSQPVTTGSGYANADGTFPDDYTLSSGPNPCSSSSTQVHYVNGRQVSTFSVTWTYDGVSVQ